MVFFQLCLHFSSNFFFLNLMGFYISNKTGNAISISHKSQFLFSFWVDLGLVQFDPFLKFSLTRPGLTCVFFFLTISNS